MVTQAADGRCVFRLFLPWASRVEVVGDFTGWQAAPIPMSREEGGWWRAETVVRPGDHEFQYLVDGDEHLTDYAAQGVARGRFGAWVSLLNVPVSQVREVAPASLAAA